MRALRMSLVVMGLLLWVGGCGPAASQFTGTYPSTVTGSLTVGSQVVTINGDEQIEIEEGNSADLLIKDSQCSVPADLDAEGFVLRSTACTLKGSSATMNLTVTGDGDMNSRGRLTINFKVTGTAIANDGSSYPVTGHWTSTGERL